MPNTGLNNLTNNLKNQVAQANTFLDNTRQDVKNIVNASNRSFQQSSLLFWSKE